MSFVPRFHRHLVVGFLLASLTPWLMPGVVWATLLAETAPAEWMQPAEDAETEGEEQVKPETVAEILNHRLFRTVANVLTVRAALGSPSTAGYTYAVRGFVGSQGAWAKRLRATVVGTVQQGPVALTDLLRRVSAARPQGP